MVEAKKGVNIDTSKSSLPSSVVSEQKIPKEQTSAETLKKELGLELGEIMILDRYSYMSKDIPVTITIYKSEKDFVPNYAVSIAGISRTTEVILEKIREDLIKKMNLEVFELSENDKTQEAKFKAILMSLLDDYFPNLSGETREILSSYLMSRALGMGNVDVLLNDQELEEVAIDNSKEAIWVYHRKHGWLKTNVYMSTEDQIKQHASRIGRRIGRQLNTLNPLLDAFLATGERVNATLSPITINGNTITIRKFSEDPWTITRFLKMKTMTPSVASLIWLVIQYELSALIVGGTASGKTSTLNVLTNFIQPNQRIISIEETKELKLPSHLYWVPMLTRAPNAEGKGEVSMEDLLINSLRMRPDRILVGEVRRRKEAETLFEAIHTGHSCYATFHANDSRETIARLTNPPVEVPKALLPAINLIIVQFRNRRTGVRRTFQLTEVNEDCGTSILYQYDSKKDLLFEREKSRTLMETLRLFTGYTPQELLIDLKEKERVLKYLVNLNIEKIDDVGRVIAEYYTNYDYLMKKVNANKPLL